jgi:hypothetical protein
MKIKILLPVLAILLMLNAFSQRAGIELTFTAIDSATHVQLDSVKVMNRTTGSLIVATTHSDSFPTMASFSF